MSDCKDAGVLIPVVDRARCEARGDCVRVCPYHVFEVKRLAEVDKAGLSWLARFKARVHGDRQAFVVRGADCHGCGLCVSACPERAIKLAATR
jgi:NAD-dependent dihydropyrimidine dehydrogenase PreA subunit